VCILENEPAGSCKFKQPGNYFAKKPERVKKVLTTFLENLFAANYRHDVIIFEKAYKTPI